MTDQVPQDITTHVTIPNACRRAGIGRSSLYKALAQGEVTARKLGTRVLIEVASLDRWVSSLPIWRPTIGPDAIGAAG